MIFYGVPQGSILGPLNIYVNDLFIFSLDSKLLIMRMTVHHVIKKLENDSPILIQSDQNNYLEPNPDKWHLLLRDADNDLSILISDK